MLEHEKAKAWAERRGLSADKVAELTGYGRRSIYWFWLGQAPPSGSNNKPQKVSPWVWQRFKTACAGVEAQLTSGKGFDW